MGGGVEVSTYESSVIRGVPMGAIDANGHIAIVSMVHERVDPLPYHFVASRHFEQSATRSLAGQH